MEHSHISPRPQICEFTNLWALCEFTKNCSHKSKLQNISWSLCLVGETLARCGIDGGSQCYYHRSIELLLLRVILLVQYSLSSFSLSLSVRLQPRVFAVAVARQSNWCIMFVFLPSLTSPRVLRSRSALSLSARHPPQVTRISLSLSLSLGAPSAKSCVAFRT